MKRILLCIVLMGTGLAFAGPPGVLEQFYHLLQNRPSKSYRELPAAPATRTYPTDHLLIHYQMKGPNAVRWTPEDSSLKQDFDSLYTQLSASNSSTADARLIFLADSLGWGHPAYILKAGESFELAYRYYVDTLEMNAPTSPGRSYAYNQSAVSGKYHVEIVDIGTVEPNFFGQEIYALTVSPGQGASVLLENDFLYNPRTLEGETVFDTLLSVYNGVSPTRINNYYRMWEEGIRVTAAHEFYHSVQYTYTPNLPSPSAMHFWYEAAATAMEERLADDVDDYLQYLPFVFDKHATRSVSHYCQSCLEPYGNGIFYNYLARELGPGFDKRVWEFLRNSEDIGAALQESFLQEGTSLVSLYPGFGLPMIYNQDPAPPFAPHNPDAAVWPALQVPPLDLSAGSVDTLFLPGLSYEFVELRNSLPEDWLLRVTLLEGEDVGLFSLPDTSLLGRVVWSGPNALVYAPDAPDNSRKYLYAANASWNAPAEILVEVVPSVRDTVIQAFPNPIPSSAKQVHFTRLDDGSDHAIVFYDALGQTLDTLALARDTTQWQWSLPAGSGSKLPPGAYLYAVDGGPLQSLFLLSGSL